MPQQKIKKAVFPVAGLGTRFLPATKANPKEILPIVDKPLIQYAVEEAIEAGIEELIFVTSSAKRAIEDHFDHNLELEMHLQKTNKLEQLEMVKNILPQGVSCAYIRQSEPRGLGHAILCARNLVGNEPFAVLLADDLINAPVKNCLAQMVDIYQEHGGQVIAAQKVAKTDIEKYGVIAGEIISNNVTKVEHIVEKPRAEDAPSNLTVTGRYILQPEIFTYLAASSAGALGEIQLTDSLTASLDKCPTYAYEFAGDRYDCGSKLGYVEATLAYAMQDPEIAPELGEVLRAALAGSKVQRAG
jgi:UTP--glucose-1-phosphate uridylyltransferase